MERFRRLWKKNKYEFPNRFIFIGNTTPEGVQPPANYDRQKYPDNEVISSKYTVLNFLPKNLFEQFRRIANTYFLLIGIIMLVINSPVSPWTTWLPLLFVVIITGAKQGYEDFLRHVRDREVNLQLIDIVRNGEIQKAKAKDIRLGDIVRIKEEESFPCDLVLLSSSDEEGKCYLTTVNLDGETNYKTKISAKTTRDFDQPEKLERLRGHIECQQPTVNLYQFIGTLTVYERDGLGAISSTKASLGLDNLLLRGAKLKDTDFIYGCAVYTGQQTKLGLNSLITRNKFSTVERSMNRYLVVFMGILALEIVLCTMQKYLFLSNLDEAYYLGEKEEVSLVGVLADLSAFLVIFSYIVPISLYTTLEVQKFTSSQFFGWDLKLYCESTDEPAICNTSDLNEELGQVQYLFTDKTGTLTENCMQFRQCSIVGKKYTEENGMLMVALDGSTLNLQRVEHLSPAEEQFLITLALCHTATVTSPFRRKDSSLNSKSGNENPVFTTHENDFEYQASSPDEKALLEACQKFGIIYHGETGGICTISVNGEKRTYRRLHILEFDSNRKRMSVIVKFPDDSIWLLCKGAESTVLPKCIAGWKDETEQHIKDYAMLGLRTLTIASCRLNQEKYEEIDNLLEGARQTMEDREKELASCFDAVEVDLTLLGATGVEDQLQEEVQETLESLKIAGIKVWVLTGDKLETAVNIAYSCGQFKRGMHIFELSSSEEVEDKLTQYRKTIRDECDRHYGMVIDGHCLSTALTQHRTLLAEVTKHCEAVVCCRMSPIQKAEVVKLVKEFPEKPTTAAIGDGANDVSMIQEAHIGLGIMGKEGRQAVRCADFAFARFHYLRRVLFIHGQWYYWRISSLAMYFFYKNLVFNTPVVFFSIFNAYSTQPVYDSFLLTMYNITFTGLPVFLFTVLDQNFTETQLLNNLHLYGSTTGDARMSWKQFFKWNILALWHAIVIYFGTHLLYYYECDVVYAGQPLDFVTFGTIMCQVVAWVTNLKLLLESRYWTLLFTASVAVSIMLGFSAVVLIYCAYDFNFVDSNAMLWIYMVSSSSPAAWLLHFMLVVLCLLPDLLVLMAETHVIHNDIVYTKSSMQRANSKLNRIVSYMTQRSKKSVDLTI
ncbi:phospholipid-transporting ATPase IF-like [Daphnia pulicaria]|uniref:phospholipid-transporting ATPase IF-like n=1 Tax=Daphnia pulicaria TaxID=35523 RepID=UPI001EEBBE4B|nr:phospholipid-transporting ATPase IF-like [Daphnia pulicaria]